MNESTKDNDKKNSFKDYCLKVILFVFKLLFGSLLSFFSFPFLRKAVAKGKAYLLDFSHNDSKLEKIKQKAADGDALCQLELGIMCSAGVGGRIDHRSSLFWFRKAAEQGEPNAQMLVAIMYLEGLGVRRNYIQAVRWAQLSAMHGNVISQLLMGAFLEDGVGVKRNKEQAIHWYKKASNSSVEIGARQRLGTLYIEGKGVSQNTEEGLKYLNESAEMGDVHAAFQLGMIYYNGKFVEQDYKKAFDWYKKAAERKFTDKKNHGLEVIFGQVVVYGEMYTRTVGQIMKRNSFVSRDAQFYMGLMYETGRGTEKDMELSKKWYQKAADAGDEIAKQRLISLAASDS